jgi:hypothetical protein
MKMNRKERWAITQFAFAIRDQANRLSELAKDYQEEEERCPDWLEQTIRAANSVSSSMDTLCDDYIEWENGFDRVLGEHYGCQGDDWT